MFQCANAESNSALQMIDTHWWPSDYFASRERFIELGRSCGACMDSHQVAAVGPAGEPLSVDVASLTSSGDEHLIFLVSGVHGVEGFIGASVQMQALQMLANSGLPARTGIVMIHAANPWGYAHLRRVDDRNMDVNRNFFDPSVSPPASHPDYALLDPVINPRRAPDTTGEIKYWFNAIMLMIRNLGIAKLFKPIAEGQYDFPQGVFFGGYEVGESCSLLQELVLNLSANARRVSILDIHSGLGPKSTASLIGNSNIVAEDQCLNWLRNHYGQPVFMDSSRTNAYDAKGTFSQWCQQNLRDKRFLYLCVEIGTVNPVKLFSALRRENQAHHWASSSSTAYVQSKQALLEVFAPRSRQWRNRSVAQGVQILDKTINSPMGFVDNGD